MASTTVHKSKRNEGILRLITLIKIHRQVQFQDFLLDFVTMRGTFRIRE